MDGQQSTFTGFAIVELMGHQREIGWVSTEYFGGVALFRVDTPELPEREFILKHPEHAEVSPGVRQWCAAGTKVKRPAVPARSRLVSPSALYAMNPCSEEAALAAIEATASRPLIAIDIPAGLLVASHPDEDDDEDGPENDEDEYQDQMEERQHG